MRFMMPGLPRWLPLVLVAATVALAPGFIRSGTAQDAGPPPNDDFEDAVRLVGQQGGISGDNIGATSQAGEPAHAGAGGISSVWYRIRSQRERVVRLDTFRSDFNTVISVYTGDSVDDLTLVADNDDVQPGFLVSDVFRQSQVAFLAMGGTTYHIAVDGFAGEQGSFRLRFRTTTDLPPPNDDVEDAVVLDGRSGSVTGDNRNATQQPFETFATDFLGALINGGTRSVWYRIEATRDGVILLDTFGSDFDTGLFVYEGDPADNLLVALSNDATEEESSLAFLAEAGETYHVAVDGVIGPDAFLQLGDIRLNFRRTNRRTPRNDDFEDAITLKGESGVVSGFNINATEQNQEPASSEPNGGASVWWQWRAPFSGTVSFTTARSSFDTVLTVWQGGNLAALDEIASNDDATTERGLIISQSVVTFVAEEGQLYRIEVDGFDNSQQGNISLAFAPGRPDLKVDFE